MKDCKTRAISRGVIMGYRYTNKKDMRTKVYVWVDAVLGYFTLTK